MHRSGLVNIKLGYGRRLWSQCIKCDSIYTASIKSIKNVLSVIKKTLKTY